LVFIKKSNQTEKKIKKKTKIGSNRPVLVRFGFLGQKLVQTGLAWFFPVWLGFFQFWFGSVFLFFAYKTEPNRSFF
jgi:hypothetical protein